MATRKASKTAAPAKTRRPRKAASVLVTPETLDAWIKANLRTGEGSKSRLNRDKLRAVALANGCWGDWDDIPCNGRVSMLARLALRRRLAAGEAFVSPL
jgi:hypothetical protein